MPEENVETPEAVETETQPTIDLDSTVKVDGEEISIKDLITARDEAVKIKEYNEHAKTLISPSGSDTETRETAVRYLMNQEGYSPEDINEYINWSNQVQEETPMEQPPMPAEIPEDIKDNPEAQQEYDRQQKEQAAYWQREQDTERIAQVEERQQRLGTEMMKKEMEIALSKTMDSNEEIKKLMGIDSGGENRQEVLRSEVELAMMSGLRSRRAAGENFNQEWFAEEAGKAAQTVYDKFRSVIGDPDKIQRSPETATDSDSLFNQPPVEPPKYERGDSMGDINVKTREWTLDTLLRGMNDSGGESKT